MTDFDEPSVRLVYTDLGLPELFARTANDAGLPSTLLHADDIAVDIIQKLNDRGAKRIYMPISSLLGRLDIATALEANGFEIVDTDLIDAAITDCYAAIAETGSLAFELTPNARRVLAAKVRIAVVDPRACVGDLLDLVDRIRTRPGELFVQSGPTDFLALVMH